LAQLSPFWCLAANGCFYLQRGCMARVSPVASFFLLLRQKKETKEKATPDRSKARNKIDSLRRLRNSQFASVELLKQGAGLKPQTINFKRLALRGGKAAYCLICANCTP
jgi:hypothetical protein